MRLIDQHLTEIDPDLRVPRVTLFLLTAEVLGISLGILSHLTNRMDLFIQDITPAARIVLDTWDFNACSTNFSPRTIITNLSLIEVEELLPIVAQDIFSKYSLLDNLHVDKRKFNSFIEQIAAGYFDNP